MVKKLLFAVWAVLHINLFFGQSTTSEINGGTTSYTYRDYAPLNPYFSYNYTQILYSASELTAAGLTAGASISGLQFVYGVDAGVEGDFDDWVIYMGNTSKTSFGSTSSSEWISTANMTQVFNNTVSLGTAGASNWFTVNFTTNFTWDGTSNIVIAVDENSPNYATNTDPWKSTDPSGSNYEVLQYISDATNPNPASPPTPDYRWSSRPILKLKYTNCTPAIISSVNGTSPTTCGGTNGQIQVNTSGVVSHYSKDNGVSWVASSSNSYTFNSLTAGSYTIKVKNGGSCITTYTSNPVILSNPSNPPTPTAVNGAGCGTGTVQLGVTTAMNGTINWYSNASLTTLVGSTPVCTNASPCTTTWTTPSISTTTSYWATRTNLSNCTSAAVEVIATVGNTSPTNVSAGSNTAICLGNSTTLSGSATGAVLTHELYSENFNACSGLLNPSICGWTYGIFSNADSWTFWKISNSCSQSGNALTLYDDYDGQDCDYDEYGFWSDPSIDFISYPQVPINAAGYQNLSLTFDWKCVGEVGYDYGNVMYSLNGTTWSYATSTNYVNQSSWTSATVSLPAAVNNTSFYIGFEWRNDGSDGGGVGTAFSVDNIRITGQKYAPVTYSWTSNPSGFSSSTNAPGSVTPTGTTTYTMTATSNGCSVSSPVTITVNQPNTSISVSGTTISNGDYLWNGNSTTNFSTLSNWFQLSAGNYSTVTSLPTSTDNIFVVTSAQGGSCISNTNNPSIATSTVSLKNISIGTGASLSLGANTLNVSGTFINQGTFNAGTGLVNFNGGTQTIPALSYYSLSSGAAGVKTLGGNIIVSGSLQLNDGTIRLNGNTLTYSGNDFQFTNGNMDASAVNSKLKFTNSQAVTIPSGIFNGSVYNLEVAGTANVVADNTFTISNNLNLVSSNFVISDSWDVTVQGSITKSSGSAISLGATQSGKIIFEGTSIDMGTTDNLRFNRIGAGDIQVNGNLVVNGELELVKGVVSLGTNNLTLNGFLGTIGGGAYIKTTSTGKFIRKTASTGVEYLFPVGQSYYTPIKITFTGGVGASSTLTSRVVSGLHPDADPSVTNYARTGYYWEMNSSNMTNPTYTVTLKYDDNTIINAGGETELDLRPAKYSSSTGWLSSNQCTVCYQGTTIGTSTLNTTTNEIVWSGVTGFSDFAGFGQGNGSPLPVELVSFSANCENEGVQLSWQTASEFNASHFTVEKSTDGYAWDKIGEVSAAGTSNSLLNYGYFDRNAISGINYYRLIQVDFDGTEKEYAPIMANCASDASKTWMSYPNPSDAGFQVVCDYPELVGDATLTILDASGKLVGLQAITLNEGINLFVVNQELTPGIYFLNISNGAKSTPVLRHAVR
jgi:hypothetical protein